MFPLLLDALDLARANWRRRRIEQRAAALDVYRGPVIILMLGSLSLWEVPCGYEFESELAPWLPFEPPR